MSKKNNIIIIGAGGHCRPMLDIASQNYTSKIKIYDIGKSFIKKELILGYPVVDYFKNIKLKNFKDYTAFLAIGDNKIRCRIYNKLKKIFKLKNLISKRSYLSKGVKIGEANFINNFSYIGQQVVIGNNNILNTGCIIEHEVKIGNNCHLGPGTKIGGRSVISNNVLIGIGSTVINNIKICQNVIIGAGSVVVKNVNIPGLYCGSPIRKIK
jgi:UDP-perosamine 4-acetyltransferase